MDSYELDPASDWQPYYFPVQTSKNAYASFRDNKYVVVRKGMSIRKL